ncbi:hypothetical protein D9X30_1193 [Cupriavidus sp. U2]|nr:hypothetical protein D9X30_1193 [Cupriavidus sp. U2]
MGGNSGQVATATNGRYDLNGGRLDVSGNTTGTANQRAVSLDGTWGNIGGGSIRVSSSVVEVWLKRAEY